METIDEEIKNEQEKSDNLKSEIKLKKDLVYKLISWLM